MKPKIVTTLSAYSWTLFGADLVAGVTVAMVAAPLSIAIAIASGAAPAAGLVTAIVGGFLISLFGGSRVQIGGPTGAFIVVVFGVIAAHGYDGLVLATLMAGLILVVSGLSRVGGLIRYVPEAVINGFTIGIGVIIAASQLKDFLGLSMGAVPAEFLDKIGALWAVRATVSWAASGIGVMTLLLIVGLRRAAPRFPGLIVAVALASVLVAYLDVGVDTIASRFGALPNRWPLPSIPAWSVDKIVALLPSAVVIAFLAGVESLLSAVVADRMTGGHHRPNAEILAQGAANIGSALFGGLPATGAIARTATNVRAGGKTPMAGIIHAVTILIVTMTAAEYAGYLALPALAALLLLTAFNMTEPHRWRSYCNAPVADRVLLVLTLVLTVIVGLSVAIGVGVCLGLAQRLASKAVAPVPWTPPDR